MMSRVGSSGSILLVMIDFRTFPKVKKLPLLTTCGRTASMAKTPARKSPSWVPFKSSKKAPSYTPKPGGTKSGDHLKRLKDGNKGKPKYTY